MTGLYLPGAHIVPGRSGGSMLGGARKCVWHTTENDPAKTSAANVAAYLVGSGNTVHLVWHPVTGEVVAMLPANVAGRGLENHPGGVETNRGGSVVIQIEVVGRASQPFTDGPCVGLPAIQAWLTSLGIPAVWAGTPDRSAVNWAKPGHFGHSDVPENSHTDPGNINKIKLTTQEAPDMDAAQAASLQNVEKMLTRLSFGLDNGTPMPYSVRGEIPARLRSIDANTVKPLDIPAIIQAARAAAPDASGFTVEALAKAINDDAAKRMAN